MSFCICANTAILTVRTTTLLSDWVVGKLLKSQHTRTC